MFYPSLDSTTSGCTGETDRQASLEFYSQSPLQVKLGGQAYQFRPSNLYCQYQGPHKNWSNSVYYYQNIEQNRNSDFDHGPLRCYKCAKMTQTGNNSNLDLVNINAYIKFGELIFICSQDIERHQSRAITLLQICKTDR